MEIVLGFFKTKRFQALKNDGILSFGSFVHEIHDLLIEEAENFSDLWGHRGIIETALLAMYFADKIHFVCDELDLSFRPEDDSTYTMVEYYAIISTPSFLAKVEFHGKVENDNARINLDEHDIEIVTNFKQRYNIH